MPLIMRKQRRVVFHCAKGILLVCGLSALWSGWAQAAVYSWPDVVQKARQQAQHDYKQPNAQVPDWLKNLSYEQWQDIRFHSTAAMWMGQKLPFVVQFYHLGSIYTAPVDIRVIQPDGKVGTAQFSSAQFYYGPSIPKQSLPGKLGYAGFSLYGMQPKKNFYSPFAEFLGASFFRGSILGKPFGTVARGLAVDTGLPSGEEFTFFKEFWIVQPKPKDRAITIYALLDAPSITGAYRFVIQPSASITTMDIQASLFRRRNPGKLGLAPLGTTYFYGENARQAYDDYRIEVHDADGLLMHSAASKWIWRPLQNPKALVDETYPLPSLLGYGLLQRDRRFDHYGDIEAAYQDRPHVWVTPKGNWGGGELELFELPIKNDMNRNVLAFWSPKKLSEDLAQPIEFAYTLSWSTQEPVPDELAHTAATRISQNPNTQLLTFDIDWQRSKRSATVSGNVQANVQVNGGKLLGYHIQPNPQLKGWRLTIQVQPANGPVELKAGLSQKGESISESWRYTWLP